jgi:hypothetical protein
MSEDQQIADFLGSYYSDLRSFIDVAFPWGEKGTVLEHYSGLDLWAAKLADDISNQVAKNKFDGIHPVPAIRVAVSSGNGVGKSTFAAFFCQWILCTRPYSVGTITAGNGTQLRTRTFAEQIKWAKLNIASNWWDIRSETIRHKIERSKWGCSAITWNQNSPDSFAGQHSRTSSSFYICDEASGIPESIFEMIDGGLTDGEAFLLILGNPNKRSGRLYDSVFGPLKDKCISRTVDSRTCKFTNKDEIQRWIEERGSDSDWVKVHVYGEPPSSFDLSFIDMDRIDAARQREIPTSDGTEPLIMGIDFARGGSDYNRISYRRGRDMRSIPSKGIPGEKTKDTTLMVSYILEEIRDKQPDAIFGDATGIGGPIMDHIRSLVKNIPVVDVQFAGKSPDERYGNMRAYMWGQFKEWLVYGCIEDSKALAEQIGAPEFYHSRDKLFLESKEEMAKRDVASPDWADSEVLTFAYPVAPRKNKHVDAMVAARRARNQRASHGKPKGWMSS